MESDTSDFSFYPQDESRISERTIDRLRQYLCILDSLEHAGNCTVSSSEIAGIAGVKSGLVRKDLCHFGGFGRPSVGYNISYLKKQIRDILKLNEEKHLVLIGGKILRFDASLEERLAANNCRIDVILTLDETKYDTDIKQIPLNSTSDISRIIRDAGIQFAIISEYNEDCMSIVDTLVSGGVKAILNLTPNTLKVPAGVTIRNLDIPGELIALSFKCPDKLNNNTGKFDIIDNDAV